MPVPQPELRQKRARRNLAQDVEMISTSSQSRISSDIPHFNLESTRDSIFPSYFMS